MLSARGESFKRSSSIIPILGNQGKDTTECSTQTAVVVTSAWREVKKVQDTFVSVLLDAHIYLESEFARNFNAKH